MTFERFAKSKGTYFEQCPYFREERSEKGLKKAKVIIGAFKEIKAEESQV